MPYTPGQKFGHLTVIERLPDVITPSGQRKLKYLCECDCPDHTRVEVLASHLASGHTVSCGCVSREKASERMIEMHTTHGLAETRLYSIYRHMVDRCYIPTDEKYKDYGGRGIRICPQWHDPNVPYKKECVIEFYNWAMMHGYRDDLTIDRIDVNGNYCPENCRWANATMQANNKTDNRFIDFNGCMLTTAQLADVLGVNRTWFYQYLSYRNFDLSAIMYPYQTPYGYPVGLFDYLGNQVPINAFYYVNQYGYPISQANYVPPQPVPAMWQCDANGIVTNPIL